MKTHMVRKNSRALGVWQMLNHIQFLRQTAAVLLACGLIVSLLPGLAAAQDLSTQETRTTWLMTVLDDRGESDYYRHDRHIDPAMVMGLYKFGHRFSAAQINRISSSPDTEYKPHGC